MTRWQGPTLAVVALGGIALFGNGLKSIVSSSVLVSEAQFARDLHIPVERTGLLLEAIVAGMVIAIALCPIVLQRVSARRLGLVASAVAAASFAAFGLLELSGQSPQVREFAMFVCFTLGSGALACLAPAAQALIAGVRQQYAAAYIADRSTLAATAQVAGTFMAGALVHRWPLREKTWLLTAAAITVAGVLSISAPNSDSSSCSSRMRRRRRSMVVSPQPTKRCSARNCWRQSSFRPHLYWQCAADYR